MKRQIYLISDSTGITARALADSLLNQFADISYDIVTFSYVDTPSQLSEVCEEINQSAKNTVHKPVVFSTLVDGPMRVQLSCVNAHVFDVMGSFLTPLEEALGMQASPARGFTHGRGTEEDYHERIDAINYALNNDDGVTTKNYDKADVILVGVSRCGKTPTSLYLAMQYGLHVANYPLVSDDFDTAVMPDVLKRYRDKLFGLSIDPERLVHIRQERRPDSPYASLSVCKQEVRLAEDMFRKLEIPVCDVSQLSIEEISTTILHQITR